MAETNGMEPAYPVPTTATANGDILQYGSPGLTRRELFAAMAMQGALASWPEHGRLEPEATARCAVSFADALLKELSK